MEQAVANLVTNAVKYSKENGSIHIGIKREENMVVLQVEDDGLGIGKEDLPFIFEHFFRGEKSRSRQFGGTGLGLSIVKYIVEAHGGYITVKSQLGEGSVFKIYLPLI
jgi:signal transduction histidine kinase